MQRILIIAPHQDDEILSSYHYIRNQIQNKAEINIIFVTNGDYLGPVYAKHRYFESLAALNELGIPSNNIYYMGYADTGMRLEKSFLYRLYNTSDDIIKHAPFSSQTYHPVGKKTLHEILFGHKAPYTKKNIMLDFKEALYYFAPDILVMPSHHDYHGDHKAVNYFMKDIFQRNFFSIEVMTYLIHGGNDLSWPNSSSKSFSQADCLSSQIWNQRIIVPTDTSQCLKKRAAIKKFESQQPNDLNAFLLRFAKEEEFFLTS